MEAGCSMLLCDLKISDLSIGKLVILIQKIKNSSLFELRIIECIDQDHVHLVPATLIMDDSDVTEKIPLAECSLCLKIPIFEQGDPVLFKGHSGTVLNCSTNDFHVYISLDEYPGKEFYTNLVHLNFTPSLQLISSKMHE